MVAGPSHTIITERLLSCCGTAQFVVSSKVARDQWYNIAATLLVKMNYKLLRGLDRGVIDSLLHKMMTIFQESPSRKLSRRLTPSTLLVVQGL